MRYHDYDCNCDISYCGAFLKMSDESFKVLVAMLIINLIWTFSTLMLVAYMCGRLVK